MSLYAVSRTSFLRSFGLRSQISMHLLIHTVPKIVVNVMSA